MQRFNLGVLELPLEKNLGVFLFIGGILALVGMEAFIGWINARKLRRATGEERMAALEKDRQNFVRDCLADIEPKEKSPMSDRRRVNWKNVLRWIGVLPGALLAMILVTFPIHWVVMFIHYRWGGEKEVDLALGALLAQVSPEMLERSAYAFFTPLAAVMSGARIAPAHKLKVAATLGLGIMLISIIGGITLSAYAWPRQILMWILNIAAVVCALWLVKKDSQGGV